MSDPLTYNQLEANFVNWALAQAGIRAAILVGSRARTAPPPDEWSDLDIILYATAPQVYAQEANWLNELGELWLAVLNETFVGEKEWLVLFDGGLKADFVLSTATGPVQAMLLQTPYRVVLQRGVRLLFDKEATATDLHLPESWYQPSEPPTQVEFSATVNDFLLRTTRTARLLKRGELWPAKEQCDGRLKQLLLTMLIWHAQTNHGSDHDTWYNGRYLEWWADESALAAIPATFAAYESADLWRALFATLDLFRRLATEMASRRNYPYPTEADQHISTWLVAQSQSDELMITNSKPVPSRLAEDKP